MNQKELALAIAKKFFLPQRESMKVLKFMLAQVTEDLKRGKRVYLRGFGSFTKKKQSIKKVRHPETGRIITMPGKLTIEFNPSKALLRKLS